TAALRTLGKVNTLALLPGDHVLLKRGCLFSQTLNAKLSGTANDPIVYGAYGVGDLPKIQLTVDAEAVLASGNYLIF
ncbi:hypothetical protein ACXWR7_13770, partial [Streptococcus pyogenes]